VKVEVDGSEKNLGCAALLYLNLHLYVECECVDNGYNCFGLLIF
jgi:hypothetical protein